MQPHEALDVFGNILGTCGNSSLSQVLTVRQAAATEITRQRCQCSCVCDDENLGQACACNRACKKRRGPDCLCSREVRSTEQVTTGDYLIVRLQRHARHPMYGNIVRPDVNLSLENGDYRLQAVVNHTGRTPHSGHYYAFVWDGTRVIECNDDVVSTKHFQPSRENCIFLYSRTATSPAGEEASQACLEVRI